MLLVLIWRRVEYRIAPGSFPYEGQSVWARTVADSSSRAAYRCTPLLYPGFGLLRAMCCQPTVEAKHGLGPLWRDRQEIIGRRCCSLSKLSMPNSPNAASKPNWRMGAGTSTSAMATLRTGWTGLHRFRRSAA